MNVSFLKNDPLDSVIVNTADGKPLYEAKTPFTLTTKKTTVRRCHEGSAAESGEIVAEMQWHALHSPTIMFRGAERKISHFLYSTHALNLSGSKIVKGFDGREYLWKDSLTRLALTLTDHDTGALIAESHRSKLGVLSHPRKMNIDIVPEALQNLDVIVVSFMIMESKRREILKSAAESASG